MTTAEAPRDTGSTEMLINFKIAPGEAAGWDDTTRFCTYPFDLYALPGFASRVGNDTLWIVYLESNLPEIKISRLSLQAKSPSQASSSKDEEL